MYLGGERGTGHPSTSGGLVAAGVLYCLGGKPVTRCGQGFLTTLWSVCTDEGSLQGRLYPSGIYSVLRDSTTCAGRKCPIHDVIKRSLKMSGCMAKIYCKYTSPALV